MLSNRGASRKAFLTLLRIVDIPSGRNNLEKRVYTPRSKFSQKAGFQPL